MITMKRNGDHIIAKPKPSRIVAMNWPHLYMMRCHLPINWIEDTSTHQTSFTATYTRKYPYMYSTIPPTNSISESQKGYSIDAINFMKSSEVT